MLSFLDPKRTSLKISSDLTKASVFSILFAEMDDDIKELLKKSQSTQGDALSFQSL